MSLLDTGKAIRRVTELLHDHLEDALKSQVPSGFKISVGRPEESKAKPGLNLFLYEALFDPSLKNFSLVEGDRPYLWLLLRYLITPFGGGELEQPEDSDTLEAMEYLGKGIRALEQLNYLKIIPSKADALQDNPEPLKITFNEASVELLSKLMQGGDEKYRFSMAFEVRPVMIALTEPPSSSLLVGIDYEKTPPEVLEEKEKGVHIDVLPSMGPVISGISPKKFEVNEKLSVYGNNLDLSGLSVYFGEIELGVTTQQYGKLTCIVNGEIEKGKLMSAGSHSLKVVKTLSSGRLRSSNLLEANLLPKIDSVSIDSLIIVSHPDDSSREVVESTMTVAGSLLGTLKDDIIVTFFREGQTTGLIEVTVDPPPDPPTPDPLQTQLTVQVTANHRVLPDVYKFILFVNGQQARKSPEVKLKIP